MRLLAGSTLWSQTRIDKILKRNILEQKLEEQITEIKIRPQAVQTIKVKSRKVLTEILYFYLILQLNLNLIISIDWKWSFYVANISIF